MNLEPNFRFSSGSRGVRTENWTQFYKNMLLLEDITHILKNKERQAWEVWHCDMTHWVGHTSQKRKCWQTWLSSNNAANMNNDRWAQEALPPELIGEFFVFHYGQSLSSLQTEQSNDNKGNVHICSYNEQAWWIQQGSKTGACHMYLSPSLFLYILTLHCFYITRN